MKLDPADCWARLREARSAVLATVHLDRGVDAVPVVYAVDEGSRLVLPVDTVKAKRGGKLQRTVNVERDPRCVLLVDRYEEDWTRLWWVRVHATATVVDGPGLAAVVPALVGRYPAYGEPGAVEAALLLRPSRVTGWRAGPHA